MQALTVGRARSPATWPLVAVVDLDVRRGPSIDPAGMGHRARDLHPSSVDHAHTSCTSQRARVCSDSGPSSLDAVGLPQGSTPNVEARGAEEARIASLAEADEKSETPIPEKVDTATDEKPGARSTGQPDNEATRGPDNGTAKSGRGSVALSSA